MNSVVIGGAPGVLAREIKRALIEISSVFSVSSVVKVLPGSFFAVFARFAVKDFDFICG
jgi:hypothetical protein